MFSDKGGCTRGHDILWDIVIHHSMHGWIFSCLVSFYTVVQLDERWVGVAKVDILFSVDTCANSVYLGNDAIYSLK